MMRMGYNILTQQPIEIDIFRTGHMCVVGGTGSGKSTAILYCLYNLLKNHTVDLSICDFKKSGDYKGISNKFAEFADVTRCIEVFYDEFEKTPENNSQLKILLIDEYASYVMWLTQKDKKTAEKIKQIIATTLALGRSRRCFVWCVQQRITATLFPAGIGAVDNFQICLGLGRLSVESRKSLFAGEHLEDTTFEENFHPKLGQGLVLIDGQELQPMQIPHISSVERLKLLLQKMQEKNSL